MTAPYLVRVALRGCPPQPTPLTLGTWGVMTDAYQDVLTDAAFQELVVYAYKLGIRSFDLALLWDGERAMRLLAEAQAISDAHRRGGRRGRRRRRWGRTRRRGASGRGSSASTTMWPTCARCRPAAR